MVIAETEKLEANSSFGKHLDDINSFISNYEVINNQHYEDMFQLHNSKKTNKERPKDRYQMEYERKVLLKYGLYEYLEKWLILPLKSSQYHESIHYHFLPPKKPKRVFWPCSSRFSSFLTSFLGATFFLAMVSSGS